MNQWKIRTLVAVMTLGALTGCSTEAVVGYGDLHVTYRVGSGSQSCEDVEIAFVTVEVLDSAGVVVANETVVCNPTDQSVLFEDIAEGTYEVTISGLNDQNDPIYQAEESESVTIAPDQTNGPVNFILDQIRPSIQVWVGFSDVGGCERFEVEEIVIVLYENGASVVFDERFTCAERIENALLIEDLSETSTYDIRVRGTNENDEYTFEFNRDGIEVSAGSPSEVSAGLTACSGVCSAP